MKTKLQKITENELKEKRLIYLASTPGISSPSEDLGLENPDKVTDADNNQTMMEKVGKVYVIDDPQDFYDTFSFLEDIDGVYDLNLDEVIQTGEVDSDKRAAVMEALIGRMGNLTAQDTWNKINAHQGETLDENTDVTDSARSVLDDLSEAARNYDETSEEKPDSESQYYKNLAAVVESMGLKKDQLMRTNELTGRVKTLEQARNLTQSRLTLLQSHIKHVEEVEAKAKESHSRLRKWGLGFMDTIMSSTGAYLGFSGAAAGHAAAMAATTGAVALSPISLLGGGAMLAGLAAAVGINKLIKGITPGFNRYSMAAADAESVNLQKKLLKKGKIDIKNGQYLKDFRTTEPILMGKGSIIDGREVTRDTETAPRGAVITGVVKENIEVNLPQVKIDGELVYATAENLEKLKEEEQAKVDKVQKTLTAHNAEISTMKTSFDTNFKELQTKVSDAEGIMGSMAQQKALTVMRIEQLEESKTANGADIAKIDEQIDRAQKELEKAEQAFNEAKVVMERAKKAFKALERVQRVFGLNEKYAKQPVPAGVLKSIYEQTVNPEALTLMLQMQKQQDEKTKEAQTTLGKIDKSRMKELMAGVLDDIEGDKLSDFINDLGDLVGMNPDQIIDKHPFLRALRKNNEELFKYFMAMIQVSTGTRGKSESSKMIIESYNEVFNEVTEAKKEAAETQAAEEAKAEAKEAAKAAAENSSTGTDTTAAPADLTSLTEQVKEMGTKVTDLMQLLSATLATNKVDSTTSPPPPPPSS
jgi:hypothetical protein